MYCTASLECMLWSLLNMPQVSNFGSSFAIKPWNYFNELPSRVVYDVPEPQQCTPVDLGLDFLWPPPGSG